MLLIGESSSTKTEWCIFSRDGILEHAIIDGINPYFQSRKQISHILRLQLPPAFFKIKCSGIRFYGAGCSNEKKGLVKASLESQFRTPAEVESDLLAAARALFQNESGIACILGTGSNSCFYDGVSIKKNVKSLGFILGDEGSGASLGKAFLADCLKELAPKELAEEFYEKYKIDERDILDFIYTKESPNKILSLFSFFLSDHLDNEYIYDLVYKNIELFFTRNILQYDTQNYPVRFVGGIAKNYEPFLYEIANKYSIKIDLVTDKSMPGLLEYHKR